MKLTIIIPAYNEQTTIRQIVEYVQSVNYPIEHEIVIVDDASIDRSYEKQILLRIKNREGLNNLRLFRNRVNRGKGYSIRKGIRRSRGDIVIIQDADTEYDPHDIPKLIRPILEGRADVVYGSRFLEANRPEGMAFPNWVANKALTWLANQLYGLKLTDEATCYKVFRTRILKGLHLKANRFNFCPEVTALLARKRIPIMEIPIHYRGRGKEDGKKVRAWDFFPAVSTLIRYRFGRIGP